MKHDELAEDILEYLSRLALVPTSEQAMLLARHLELVEDANRRVNLTRIVDRLDAVRRHTADSLTVLPDIEKAPSGTLLDLGSGAGFPGIPLAICSDRRVELVDSVAKKVRELSRMVEALELGDRVTVTAGRAEAIARAHLAEYAIVTARAVSELPALVELAAPLLAAKGRLICLKGTPSRDETDRAAEVGEIVGMKLAYQRVFDLPGDVGRRTILVYEKTRKSRITLPRREGSAQHSPLA